MTIQRMEHVGIVVDDLVAATAFFVELGLKLQGEGPVEGGWVDRVVGLEGVRAEIAMVETPDGHGRLELTKLHTPSGRGGDRHAPANTQGIRHVAFAVDEIDAVVASLRARGAELVGEVERYEDSYRLCCRVVVPNVRTCSWRPPSQPHAGGHRVAVHVQSGAPFDHALHDLAPFRSSAPHGAEVPVCTKATGGAS